MKVFQGPQNLSSTRVIQGNFMFLQPHLMMLPLWLLRLSIPGKPSLQLDPVGLQERLPLCDHCGAHGQYKALRCMLLVIRPTIQPRTNNHPSPAAASVSTPTPMLLPFSSNHQFIIAASFSCRVISVASTFSL